MIGDSDVFLPDIIQPNKQEHTKAFRKSKRKKPIYREKMNRIEEKQWTNQIENNNKHSILSLGATEVNDKNSSALNSSLKSARNFLTIISSPFNRHGKPLTPLV